MVLAQKRNSDTSAKEEKFRIRTIRSLNIPRTNFWVYGYLFAKKKLVKESIEHFKPDVIYAHNPYDTYVSRGFGIPVVCHIHSLYTEYFMSQESLRTYLPRVYWNWFWRYRLAIEQKALSNSNLVVTYSKYLADLAKERGARNVKIVPNGIDTSLFTSNGQKSTEIKKPAVVYVGRIEKVKGITYLLQAAHELPNVNFYLIGELKDHYEFPSNVYPLGSREPNSIPIYLRSADIFLNPVVRDGFEIVNMEAMACGVPVITTDSFERSELYKHSAILVKPEDSHQIVTAIRNLLSDESLRLKIIREGRVLASHHDWAAISLAIENLLTTVVDQNDTTMFENKRS